jgi:hypothetical protein
MPQRDSHEKKEAMVDILQKINRLPLSLIYYHIKGDLGPKFIMLQSFQLLLN